MLKPLGLSWAINLNNRINSTNYLMGKKSLKTFLKIRESNEIKL